MEVIVAIIAASVFALIMNGIVQSFRKDVEDLTPEPMAYEVPHFHVDRAFVNDKEMYWKHKKGGLYTILYDNATLEQNLEQVVVYRALEGGRIWVRPASEFFDGRFTAIYMED